jgi:peptidoglycan-associated lipoprotein
MAMADTQRTPETKGDGVKQLVILVGVLATVVGGALGGSWLHFQMMEASATSAGTPTVTVAAGTPAPTTPETKMIPEPRTTPGVKASTDSEVVHTDVYFDFKSSRLRADVVSVLQETAAMIAKGGNWVVLVQGYSDQRGPAVYNRTLAERRANEVKRFLVELGVPEPSVKVVTIGPEGALCDDPGKDCQQLNRRVHLELRRLTLAAGTPIRAKIIEGDELNVAVSPASGR